MISHTTGDFRHDFGVICLRRFKSKHAAYRLFLADPGHPGLRFKKLPPFEDLWSVRITGDYRAIGRRKEDVIVWFFIGSHADYDQLLGRL